MKADRPEAKSKSTALVRLAIVILGISLGQAFVYGPSLCGSKILLPLDVLAVSGTWIPRTPEVAEIEPQDLYVSDLVFYYEPARQFAISELHQGRLPIWWPRIFCGAPCYRWNCSPTFLPAYLITSPVVLAWTELLVALVAGTGAYTFCRRVPELSYWPSAIASWIYPLAGAFCLWRGFWLVHVMCCLPWVLLATEMTLRRPGGWAGPALAILTCTAIVGGALDIAGQVLLASGIYAVARLIVQYAATRDLRAMLRGIVALTIAWAVGIAASGFLLLPEVESTFAGVRAHTRSHGTEERPPIGISALPQVVIPDMYGATYYGSCRIVKDSTPESSIGGFIGLLATLVLAPLALCSRRHRALNVIWLLLAFVGLSWTLNVPGMVYVLRLPLLNMMSHCRFVFVTAFALLMLAATGMDTIFRGAVSRRWWFVLPTLLVAGMLGWCSYRIVVLPEPIATQIDSGAPRGKPYCRCRDPETLVKIKQGFTRSYAFAALVSGLALILWCWMLTSRQAPHWLAFAIAAVWLVELLWFNSGRTVQSDPALYYPRVELLERIAASPPGRIMGMQCLPPNLCQMCGLSDVRGYDGIDPSRMTDLLLMARDPKSSVLSYARTQFLGPTGKFESPNSLRLFPVFSMLNVRYVVFRGTPRPEIRPQFRALDYWALENEGALPRTYIPSQVDVIADRATRLRRLTANNFDPRSVAYVEQPIELPTTCRGETTIIDETPTRVSVSFDMETPGLLVLADSWDPGWNAYVDGLQRPLLRTNHALRGVVVPKGKGLVEFRYEPASLRLGSIMSIISGLLICAWMQLGIRALRIRWKALLRVFLPAG